MEALFVYARHEYYLTPLLSNIMLNELDKELERRGLPFVRYADDSMIFCKSKRGVTCKSVWIKQKSLLV